MITYKAKWVNLHSKICLHTFVCCSPFEMSKNTFIECNALMCCVNSYINEKFDYPLPRGLNCTCLWLYDRLATHLSDRPVIHAKAGASLPRPWAWWLARLGEAFSTRSPSRTRWTCNSSIGVRWPEGTVVLLQCSSIPSLFNFPKRRRAKRSPDARVAVSCV